MLEFEGIEKDVDCMLIKDVVAVDIEEDAGLIVDDLSEAELELVGPAVVLMYGLTVGQGIEVTPAVGVMTGLPISNCCPTSRLCQFVFGFNASSVQT